MWAVDGEHLLGEAAEDYLKAILLLSQRGGRVTLSSVAGRLGVSSAAVTKMVVRLRRLGLADHSRAEGLHLSPAGRRIALRVLRSHRLLELFLARELGLPWEDVHGEAERLEHVVSEQVERRIDEILGHPSHDPHGHPIPTADGELKIADALPLAAMSPGDKAVIDRVADGDAGMLRHLGMLGILPGVPVEMLEPEPYGGSLKLLVSGRKQAVGLELAANVFVAEKAEDG